MIGRDEKTLWLGSQRLFSKQQAESEKQKMPPEQASDDRRYHALSPDYWASSLFRPSLPGLNPKIALEYRIFPRGSWV